MCALTAFHRHPEHLLAVAGLEVGGQARVASAHVPEEDGEGVDVDGAVVPAAEQLRGHVDRSADHRATHHRLRLTEAEVRQLAAVLSVQLSDTHTQRWQRTVTTAMLWLKIQEEKDDE